MTPLRKLLAGATPGRVGLYGVTADGRGGTGVVQAGRPGDRYGHENWTPSFDFLMRNDQITKVYEKAMHRAERAA